MRSPCNTTFQQMLQGDSRMRKAIELDRIGAVVIGRNEGERLRACLASANSTGVRVVYVDSGSTDGSAALARSLGVHVVELDASLPFSAARARNAGSEAAMELRPETRYVQFVDGDCELAEGWPHRAVRELETHPDVAVVCGRVRERDPGCSIYSRLCDMEWSAAMGDIDACGGIFMVRGDAFREAGRFNASIVAGEEPELCLRLRQAGWRILRIDSDMAVHDGAMTRFGQWWRRSVRCGYGYAVGNAMYGNTPARHYVRETRSNWAWGLIVPTALLALTALVSVWSPALAVVYPLWAVKVARYRRMAYRDGWGDALLYGAFCMLGKFPMVWGQLRFVRNRLTGQTAGDRTFAWSSMGVPDDNQG